MDAGAGAGADPARRRRRKPYSKVACMRCRRLRKKCMGGFPCIRCLGAGHVCQVLDPRDGEVHTHTAADEEQPPQPPPPPLEARVDALEHVLAHAPVRGMQRTVHSLQTALTALAGPRPLAPRFHGTLSAVKGTLVMGAGMVLEHVDWRVCDALFGASPREVQGVTSLAVVLTQDVSVRAAFERATMIIGPEGFRMVVEPHERFFVCKNGDVVRTLPTAEGDWMRDGRMRYVLTIDAMAERIPRTTARALRLFHPSIELFALVDRMMRRLRKDIPETSVRDVVVPPARVLATAQQLEARSVDYFVEYDASLPWGDSGRHALPTDHPQFVRKIGAQAHHQDEQLRALPPPAPRPMLPPATHGLAGFATQGLATLLATPAATTPAATTTTTPPAATTTTLAALTAAMQAPPAMLPPLVTTAEAAAAHTMLPMPLDVTPRMPTTSDLLDPSFAMFSPLDPLALGPQDDVLQWPDF